MGLDIALGLLVLAAAVRGWFRGFLLNAIRIGGLIGAVYGAAPLRDLARPYVAEKFSTIRPEMLDRLLWWAIAVLTFVVGVGLAGLIVKMIRRRPFGESEPSRTDQFAGFVMGAFQGSVVAAFLVSAFQQYGLSRIRDVSWANELVSGSCSLDWEMKYHPAERIWTAPPVQHFVGEIRRMGLSTPMAEGSSPRPDSNLALSDRALQAAATAVGLPPSLEILRPSVRPNEPTVQDSPQPRAASLPEYDPEFDRILRDLSTPIPGRPGSR